MGMVALTIDGNKVSAPENSTIRIWTDAYADRKTGLDCIYYLSGR
jgi:hypothetical protein